MASIKKEIDSTGAVVYKVQASGGRGRRVKRSWRPEPGWSARTIERELQKFCANLENELAAGTVSTRKEEQEQARLAALEAEEQARLAALEAERLKTFRQYLDGVYWPAKEAGFSENTRSSYSQFFRNVILPAFLFPMRTYLTAGAFRFARGDPVAVHSRRSHEKFFSLPNEIFLLKLPPSAFMVYAYLLLIEDRKTHTCHPSYNTIATATGMSKNTVLKNINVLLEAGLITVEPSSYFDKRGMKWEKSCEIKVCRCRCSTPTRMWPPA